MFLMETPVWVTFVPLVLMCLAAYVSAKRHSDTHDFKKSCKLYFPIAAVIAIGFRFVGLPLVLGGFLIAFGFGALLFFSNRFFYK